MKADPQRLEKYVIKLSGELVPRDASHPENLNRVADYIRERLKPFAKKTEDQSYSADHLTRISHRKYSKHLVSY